MSETTSRNLTANEIFSYIEEKIASGENKEAAEICEQILISTPQKDPYFVKVLSLCYHNMGQNDKSANLLKQALHLYPNDLELHASYGYAIYLNGEHEEGKNHLRIALKHGSESVFVNDILSKYYYHRKEYLEAASFLSYVLERAPSKRVMENLGICYLKLQMFDKAEEIYDRFFKEYSKTRDTLINVYNAYIGSNEKVKALGVSKELVKDYPEDPYHYACLMFDSKDVCDWNLYKKTRKTFDSHYKYDRIKNISPFAHLVSHDNPYDNYLCARSWNSTRSLGVPVKFDKFNVDEKAKKIRIGYLSRDFYDHATMHLISGVFRHHDRNKFEIYIYSYGPKFSDKYQSFLQNNSDSFQFMQHYNDEQIWEKIHEDGVNILIDLKGHTNSARISIMQTRIAPIQVQYLGFPGTSGSDNMDYIITDKIVSPIEHAGYYSEKLAYMPDSYQANDNLQEIADPHSRSDYNLPEDAFVFASFNQNYKIEPQIFDIWCELLKEVEGSVLWLASSNELSKKNLKKEAKKRGIKTNRLFFYEGIKKDHHLSRIKLADLCLDTNIVNGHTSTSDCLWAGVPVVSFLGNHFASRVASSLLNAIGLPELIGKDKSEYKSIALDIAKNPNKLKLLKEKLNLNKNIKPLYNSELFTKNLELTYTEMWERYKKGKKPSCLHFAEENKVEECFDAEEYSNKSLIYASWCTVVKNWGDSINPVIIEKIANKKVMCIYQNETSERDFYLCTGSILGLANKHATVWGAGYISDSDKVADTPKKICAVRGPLTRDRLIEQGIDCPEIYGDPALLYPRYYNPRIEKKYKLGIIPHYIDQDHKWLQKEREDVLIIDIKTEDINGLVDLVKSCDYIASSSLHGLIVADSYGIPSTWLRFSEKIIGGDFKFLDYFASVGRKDKTPLYMSEDTNLEEIQEKFYDYSINIDLDALLDACPFADKI